MSGIYDDAYIRANADALRAEDDAALDALNACHRLTDDERADIAAYWSTRPWITAVAHQRGHTLRFHDETPVRLHVRRLDDGPTDTAYDLDRIPAPPRLPRRARGWLRRIVRALTYKYRHTLMF